ncbi:hypothetical protein HD554DRAFT_2036401 [Boletus coccyginus]|nr:hypothetical protein HD554DRAFT_2036401 [Boletus coccyginus]
MVAPVTPLCKSDEGAGCRRWVHCMAAPPEDLQALQCDAPSSPIAAFAGWPLVDVEDAAIWSQSIGSNWWHSFQIGATSVDSHEIGAGTRRNPVNMVLIHPQIREICLKNLWKRSAPKLGQGIAGGSPKQGDLHHQKRWSSPSAARVAFISLMQDCHNLQSTSSCPRGRTGTGRGHCERQWGGSAPPWGGPKLEGPGCALPKGELRLVAGSIIKGSGVGMCCLRGGLKLEGPGCMPPRGKLGLMAGSTLKGSGMGAHCLGMGPKLGDPDCMLPRGELQLVAGSIIKGRGMGMHYLGRGLKVEGLGCAPPRGELWLVVGSITKGGGAGMRRLGRGPKLEGSGCAPSRGKLGMVTGSIIKGGREEAEIGGPGLRRAGAGWGHFKMGGGDNAQAWDGLEIQGTGLPITKGWARAGSWRCKSRWSGHVPPRQGLEIEGPRLHILIGQGRTGHQWFKRQWGRNVPLRGAGKIGGTGRRPLKRQRWGNAPPWGGGKAGGAELHPVQEWAGVNSHWFAIERARHAPLEGQT